MKTMNLWVNYKKILHETLPLHNGVGSVWATWESKGTYLTAKTYTTPYIIKSREVEIWNEKSCIYNNIIYPKTGSNLPCFGMDLMGFFDKKVIVVFDFQHPVENYLKCWKKNGEKVKSQLSEIFFQKVLSLLTIF